MMFVKRLSIVLRGEAEGVWRKFVEFRRIRRDNLELRSERTRSQKKEEISTMYAMVHEHQPQLTWTYRRTTSTGGDGSNISDVLDYIVSHTTSLAF